MPFFTARSAQIWYCIAAFCAWHGGERRVGQSGEGHGGAIDSVSGRAHAPWKSAIDHGPTREA
eukprot:1580817-Prymnesium_polylepis.1